MLALILLSMLLSQSTLDRNNMSNKGFFKSCFCDSCCWVLAADAADAEAVAAAVDHAVHSDTTCNLLNTVPKTLTTLKLTVGARCHESVLSLSSSQQQHRH